MKIDELNLLVVEDDDFQRQTLLNMLRSLGAASVVGAGNGKQALEIIRRADSRPVDIAFCDLNMPEMDGMEFLRHLSQEHRNIAIIILSSLDSKLLASVGRMTNMYGIQLLGAVEKPILPSHLKEIFSKYDSSAGKREPQPSPVKSYTLEEIHQGIRANQFVPYFQPKVDLRTGRLIGAEALARWIHPEHGVVSPYAFIPLLEQTRNIDGLTFHILKESTVACRSFHDQGHLLTISVNLSLVSLNDTALADKITRVVREAGVDPQYIVLEITESAAMTDGAHALENLARLCMNGFALSIDDYGTGYSSLQQLTRIAFSELKIDQSFVKDFFANKALRVVVESSIDMAHKLLVKSAAEGVESQRDWDALASIGCDTAQGYFIAMPMDATAFQDFMLNYKPKSIAGMPRQTQHFTHESSKVKILVVDDDSFTRRIILQVLHDFGFSNITDTDNAESAINLFENNAFDLIITDVNMSGMNGLEFTRLIRAGKTYAKPETRIMVLSSFSQTQILGTALALDINGFLVKPIIPAILEEKIAQAMSERLHLHSPLAYEAVKTELNSLSGVTGRAPEAAITLGNGHAASHIEHQPPRRLSLYRLRPGMTLKENVHLKDGTLILSSGHTLSELSINRLIDLKVLLPATGIAIQEYI